ncbi:uncharacterized protein PV09_01800 [Verruconis gallopava]|uniref:Uncharacterized protein n=1 Tax=Verruconis gallopava TaxID=253628 RepID=A0A0D2AMB0_9PEZI|nr:uncharacterized protein PV09_01800 [Verruconis gallopava]KIW07888.1 hypothetical protein PV09_01800 [Verruconis gallopava]
MDCQKASGSSEDSKRTSDQGTKIKFSDLPPEMQNEICKNPRMKIIAEIIPDDPLAKFKSEEKNLDFSDPKIKFLDQIYAVKRSFVFQYRQNTEAITSLKVGEIKANYETFKNSKLGEFFKTEEEKKAYLETVMRWFCQILEADRLWREYLEITERKCKLSIDDMLREARPSFVEELANKPWAQFLEKDGPGWPVDWANGPTVINKQRVPNGGIRIVEQWEKATAKAIDEIDTNPSGRPVFESGLVRAQQIAVLDPERKKVKTVYLVYDNGQALYDGDLFPMSQMIGARLDNHRCPSGWKAATIRIDRLNKRTCKDKVDGKKEKNDSS